MPKESMNEFKNEKKDLQQTWKEIKEYLKHKKKDIIIQSSINETDNVQDYFHAVPGPPPIQAPIITHNGLLKTPKKHEHEQKHKSKKLKHHRHSSSSSSSNSDYSYSTSKSNSSSNSYNQSSSHYTPENYHRHRSRSRSYHRHSHHRHDHRKKDNHAGGHERK
ncbi:MAG: hypothetical protein EZS28_055212 [Streblomastix strix]|uniref:Uncharacterized protein n=1 Tax=Streblomastix strix TaxID=222440 RepID=A0A5J4Q4B2_9EUKA|nr:MAG: hypothetical protein EZS28_055212 [Streblomastix strix]